MSNIKYVQAVPRIRALENKLLDKAKIERMIDGNSAEETFKILQETEYGTLMTNVKRPEDYEIVLSEELKRVYSFMYEVSPDENLIDTMSIRYDYHNIKVLLKGKALNKDLSYLLIPVGTVAVDDMKMYISMEDYRELTPIMKEAIQKSETSFGEHKDPQQIDIILDEYMYKDMLFRAEVLGEPYLLEFLKMNIDLINLKTLLRVKKQKKSRKFLDSVLIEGGKLERETLLDMLNGSNENIVSSLQYTDYNEIMRLGMEEYIQTGKFNVLEKLSDNFIMNFIKDSKYISFGIEPLLAYIFAKENEIKIVRIIMVGKLNNIAGDVIRERLRDIYV
ncbi:V-type ATP synthase subunit C [Clostridium ganghwense]|uniref:V-type ATP synthase subunit C n=1 Tax=Clostridium ganghwense TaxID=312089 RepID=A0ABT4CRK0_9CLOT|nr:V-type ATP synthase subunit C [Clostridium ganghwense]MCY6370841.1 V-type ATP synthase subunit C [Clostridium ganghwense]